MSTQQQQHFIDIKEKQETPFIEWFRQIVVPYWPLFLMFTIFGLISSLLYLRYATPIYQVKARILVKDEKSGFGGSNSGVVQLDIFGAKKDIGNEIEIIKSRAIIRNAIKATHANANWYSVGKIQSTLQDLNFPIQIMPISNDSANQLIGVFQVELNKEQGNIIIDSKQYGLYGQSIQLRGHQCVLEIGDLKMITSGKYRLDMASEDGMLGGIQGSLDVKVAGKQSSIIDLTLKTSNTKRGEEILEAIINQYKEAGI